MMERSVPAPGRALAVLALVAVALVLVVVATGAFASSKEASYLYTQPFTSGTLTGPNDDDLTLTLSGLRTYLTGFTDRPDRQASLIDHRDFYRRWPTAFADDPPNAALSYVPPGEDRPVTVIVELTEPVYSPETSSVTYHAVKIPKSEALFPGAEIPVSPAPGDPNLQNHIASFGPGVLFIDSDFLTSPPLPTTL